MKIEHHRLTSAQQVVSPNQDERPDQEDISLLVIHCISLPPGQYGGGYIQQLFSNQLDADEHPYFADIYQLKVSAHILICRSGEIIQFVPFNKRAWHAGKSCYQGRERCNDFSIGIELEGCETEAYSDAQYDSLQQLIYCLYQTYPRLNRQRVCGHSEIAPGRKTDPGTSFDWQRIN